MKKLLIVLSAALPFAGCSDFLDPMPNGHYTDRNLLDYPSMIRGFVEKSYDLLPTSYSGGEYVYLDGATDDVVITAQTNAMRRFAVGSGTPASDPFKTYWIRDYKGIMYANKFLDDFLGLNTRYMIDNEQNLRVQRSLQGDAYALRAWYQLDLLRKWGGRGTDGRLLGFPIVTRPSTSSAPTPGEFTRATYDECVERILRDCDSALYYLPEANRDWLAGDVAVEGRRALASVRRCGGQGHEGPDLPAMGVAGLQPLERRGTLEGSRPLCRRGDGFQTHAGRRARLRPRGRVRLDRPEQSRDHLVVELLEKQHAGEPFLSRRVPRAREA